MAVERKGELRVILYRLQNDNGHGPFFSGVCSGYSYNHLAGPCLDGWNGKIYDFSEIRSVRQFAFTNPKTALDIFEPDITNLIEANFNLVVLEVDGRSVIKGPQDQAMYRIGTETQKDCLTLAEVVEKGLFQNGN